MAAITDGTSNTALASEVCAGKVDTAGNYGYDGRGLWAWPTIGSSTYTHRLTPNTSADDVLYYGQCTGASDPSLNLPCNENYGNAEDQHYAAVRSRHPGGVNLLFVDGHVAFVGDTVDTTTWQRLGSINDGYPVVLP